MAKGCCCCFLSILFKIIIMVSIAFFIFWLIYRPQRVKVEVTDVTLSQFNITSNNILNYNLTMNITLRNPNKKMGIYYDHITASAYYELVRFDTVMLTPFYQGHKNTSYLRPIFAGQHLLVLGAKQLFEFNKEMNKGIYSIDVVVKLSVRFKFGIMKVRWLHMIGCILKVPLASSNGTSAGGTEIKCGSSF